VGLSPHDDEEHEADEERYPHGQGLFREGPLFERVVAIGLPFAGEALSEEPVDDDAAEDESGDPEQCEDPDEHRLADHSPSPPSAIAGSWATSLKSKSTGFAALTATVIVVDAT